MKNSIAIIVVAYNGEKWIAKCLQSVFANEYEGKFDVIVVDNSSTDDSVSVVEKSFPQVDLIKLHENKGFVGGNNVAIKEAIRHKYEYVLLLNQDTELEPDFLSQIIKVGSQDHVGVTQGMLVLGNERSLTNNMCNAMHYLGFGFVKHYRDQVSDWKDKEPFEIGYSSGACMLIKREVIEQVGLLDEKFFMYHEDLDICWRARLAGYKIMIAPKAVCYHYYEFNRNKEMFYWTERNRWAVLLQNYSLGTLLMLGPILLVIEFMMILYSTMSGWLWYKLKSYIWIWLNLFRILSRRWRVQLNRKVDDKEIMKHMDIELKMSEVDNPVLDQIVNPMLRFYFRIIK
jgi:hypothetical protein